MTLNLALDYSDRGRTATLNPALFAHFFQVYQSFLWIPCLGQYQPSWLSTTLITPSTYKIIAEWPEWEPAPYWMIWSSPSNLVMARKSPDLTSYCEILTSLGYLSFHLKPVPASIKSTANFSINLVGLDPKNGILGFNPNPPTNISAVFKTSGNQWAKVSQSLKTWIPHVTTLL